MLLVHLFARPEEPIIVKLLSKVGVQLGQHILDFLPLIVERMETQEGCRSSLPSCRVSSGSLTCRLCAVNSLTEELLASTADDSAQQVKDLLFARLAPLLALKVVPFRFFGLADAMADEVEQPLLTEQMQETVTKH
jgi:hypothetical protein